MLVDPYLVVLAVVVTLILIFANVYILARYSHHLDESFKGSFACKVIVVSSLTLRLLASSLLRAALSPCLSTSKTPTPSPIST